MTIDGNTIKMPNGLAEYYKYSRYDNRSLNFSLQRNQLGKKKYAELTWTDLTPVELQAILTWADDLSSHAYSNSDSRYSGGWAFTGLVTILSPGLYEKGATFMTDVFTVGIDEV
jgi:hypothetical protein